MLKKISWLHLCGSIPLSSSWSCVHYCSFRVSLQAGQCGPKCMLSQNCFNYSSFFAFLYTFEHQLLCIYQKYSRILTGSVFNGCIRECIRGWLGRIDLLLILPIHNYSVFLYLKIYSNFLLSVCSFQHRDSVHVLLDYFIFLS